MTGLPASLRWPAEWEPHDATAFTWPHNTDTWHRGVDAPRRAVTAAVLALARDEHVYLHFPDAQTCRETMAGLGEAGASVTGRVVPSNDAWCRDHGALIVRRPDGRRLALDFGFNAWGGKYPPWDLDADIAAQMAGYLDIERVSVPFVLEGGALDGNGQGVVMTTASCVLNPNRNAGVNRAQVEELFARALGARHVWWLAGEIPGDDTDGHIDNLARFVDPSRVLAVAPRKPANDAQRAMARNVELLAMQADRAGIDLRVDHLPLPAQFMARTSLPASYANFYIGNRSVLMPVYRDPADDEACALVASCFPDRELVPVDCRDLIVGLGALHCLSQQVPAT